MAEATKQRLVFGSLRGYQRSWRRARVRPLTRRRCGQLEIGAHLPLRHPRQLDGRGDRLPAAAQRLQHGAGDLTRLLAPTIRLGLQQRDPLGQPTRPRLPAGPRPPMNVARSSTFNRSRRTRSSEAFCCARRAAARAADLLCTFAMGQTLNPTRANPPRPAPHSPLPRNSQQPAARTCHHPSRTHPLAS